MSALALKIPPVAVAAVFALLLWLVTTAPVCTDEIRVATASNFRGAMMVLATTFEQNSRHVIVPIYGSTGKHYAQIVNGAPFDAFFAADSSRPERLEREGIAVAGSRFTYATGILVLWSPRAAYVDEAGQVLETGQFRHLSIANPNLAPYGFAAREALQSLGLWQGLEDRLVLGENIGQAYLFVRSGNAELGFIAGSQLVSGPSPEVGSSWRVPEHLYSPIDQQAVLLRESQAARDFVAFIQGPQAARIIREHGYATNTESPP